MTRGRKFAVAFAAAAALVLIALAAGVLVLQSQWFYNKVRERIVSAVETATGGQVELNAFAFDWKHLRAEVRGFTLHGTEPAGSAPLLHADAVTVDLKILSLLKRDVDIQAVDVSAPRIHLIVEPGGATNIPRPKVSSHSGLNPLQTVLKLRAGKFALRNGVIDIEKHGPAPFDLAGENLRVDLGYDPTVPRYRGEVSVDPLRTAFTGLTPTVVSVAATVSVEGNRIGIDSARIATGDTTIQAKGSLDDLEALHGSFQYDARSTNSDIARIFRLKLLDAGMFQSTGQLDWRGGDDYAARGKFHAYGLAYRGPEVRLTGFKADGDLSATLQRADLSHIRLSGSLALTQAPAPTQAIAVDAQIAAAHLQGPDLNIDGLTLAALGGSFHGNAKINRFDHFDIAGDLQGFDIKRTVALYGPQALPWDGLASGDTHLIGQFKNAKNLTVSANLNIAPADTARPVQGLIALRYDAGSGLLDLGQSNLTLPSSRASFSGTLGRQLSVHAETRDLNDILPALGESAAQIPVKLQNGQAVFDGSVLGSLDQPRIQGHITVSNAVYNGEAVDSFSGDADIAANSVRIGNGSIARGALHALFNGTVALNDWKITDASAISGSAAIQNAPLADIAAAANFKSFPASGAINLTSQFSGTTADPIASGDLTAVNGTIRDEPFERVNGHIAYRNRTFDLTNGAISAGPKQIQLTASYHASNAAFDSGQLQFKMATNVMPIEQIASLDKFRPGIQGTVEVSGNGTLDIGRVGAAENVRIADLHAIVAALSLRLDAQPLGDARLTADTQNGVLHGQVTSNFAGSSIQGSGDWQLTGDYPGHGSVNFTQLDFTRLREWLSPNAAAAPEDIVGSAEGQVAIDGPILKPDLLQAHLTIPKFQISSKRAPDVNGSALTLTNSGPITASLANSIVTVTSFRLTARKTDLTITGRANLKQKNALDIRVTGNVDLAILHELDRDLDGSGTVSADADVRGDISSPSVNGRIQFQNAAFNIVDVPNGLSNASGVILFSGNRATIQNLTGETGGGKVSLSGFATYQDGDALFRVHVQAQEVRVRVQGLSIVANAGFNFTGTTEHSMLTGTVTILRTSFTTDTDFSSLIAGSAEPVRTPPARTGLLGGLGFDVQINSSPDIQVQTSLTQDLELDGSLHLRGTASNPALIGRVNVTQGTVLFFGSKFNIGSGSVSFYNPVRIAPVLDIDLTTKARGIDVTLTISGPLEKLTLTPQSDPPLQFSEIVALLATGRTPTSDPALLTQSAPDQPAFQQMGASALLGEAIASPVAGRLQRFFGVSKLRIDPTLPGVDINPQARLTLEQQVTANITFTYITNVTTTNPQVIQVEWAFNKHWSAVALREENGMTGIDFFFKKRF